MFEQLCVPAIAAPMTGVSSPELTIACCQSGIAGAFPAHNARSTEQLLEWLDQIDGALGVDRATPVAVNIPMYRRNRRRDEDIATVLDSSAELIIVSVGSPREVVAPAHSVGKQVFADVSSERHARRAIEDGVDGLILLTAGAGGYTGWANPFAFVRSVRTFYDGPIVLAGGITDATSLWAAIALGCDLGYLGTVLIPTAESAATEPFRRAVIAASMDDIETTAGPAGLAFNRVRADDGDEPDVVKRFGFGAGHTAHAATDGPVADLLARMATEFRSMPTLPTRDRPSIAV